MDGIQRVLRSAEEELHALISAELKLQNYSEVSRIAAAAEQVALLAKELGTGASASAVSAMPRTKASSTVSRPRGTRSPRAKTAKRPDSHAQSGYPRFAREQDRLIKIGWSKKNESEYEHRVSRDAVVSVLTALGGKFGGGELFEADTLLPVVDASGAEMPSYQVYLVLAWLRDLGGLEKQGREGYRCTAGKLDDSQIAELWARTPSRGGS